VCPAALGLARTGLIFTRIQEGTQPVGLTQAGQTEQGIPYNVPSCRVAAGGERSGRKSAAARGRVVAVVGESGSLFCWFVLCVLLICIVVVPVPFVCCSVKLIPTHQFLPVSFHSSLHPGRGRGGRVSLLLLAAAKP